MKKLVAAIVAAGMVLSMNTVLFAAPRSARDSSQDSSQDSGQDSGQVFYSTTIESVVAGGTTYTTGAAVASGTVLTVTAAPDEGQTVATITATVGDSPKDLDLNKDGKSASYTMTDADVTFAATFTGGGSTDPEPKKHLVLFDETMQDRPGKLSVFVKGTSANTPVTSGDSLDTGTELVITAKPNDDYLVDYVSVNNVNLENGTASNSVMTYSYTIQESDIQISISASFKPGEVRTYPVTITKTGEGTIQVLDGEKVIESGARLPVDTLLTIKATPAEGYFTSAVIANTYTIGAPYQFKVIPMDNTVSAIFEKKPPSNEEVNEVVDIVNDPTATVEAKVDAIDTLIDNSSAAGLKQNDTFMDNLKKFDDIMKASGIKVNAPTVTGVPITGTPSIVGAALSGSKDKPVTLQIKSDTIEDYILNNATGGKLVNSVVFDMDLFAGSVSVSLKAPVEITLPAVTGIVYDDSLRVLHFHDDIVSSIYPKIRDGKLTITVTGFSTFAIVNVVDESDTPETPSTSGGGGGGGGSTGSIIGSTGSVTSSAKPANAASVAKDTDKAVKTAVAAGSKTAVVSLKNVSSISPAILKSIANSAKNAKIASLVTSDVMKGKAIETRLSFDPSKATLSTDVKLGATIGNKAIESTFAKYFKNSIVVLKLAQEGSFGMNVEVASKLKLDTLGSYTQLHFYSYNPATNIYAPIAAPAYFVDVNGYLHFTTTSGGAVVITGQPLTLK